MLQRTYQNDGVFMSLDTETHLIQPGLLAPPLVCGSLYDGNQFKYFTADQVINIFNYILLRADVLAGQSIEYDMGVIAARNPKLLDDIFTLYDAGRIYDISIAEQLNAISTGQLGEDPRTGRPIKPQPGKKKGGYSLAYCTSLRLGIEDAKKNDFWRKRYAILEHIPMSEWPAEAVEYLQDDVRNPMEVACKQCDEHRQGIFSNLAAMPDQAYTAFCLQLSSIWGFRVDRGRYEALVKMVDENQKPDERFVKAGFIRADGTKDKAKLKRAVVRAYDTSGEPIEVCPACGGSGKVKSSKSKNQINCSALDGGCDGTGLDISGISLPMTEGGGISTSRDTLVESGDELLMDFSENEGDKLRDTYLPFLAQGLDVPITPRANVIVSTLRTSYDDVIQLLPRQVLCMWCRGHKCQRCDHKGLVPGVRECIVARPGYNFSSVDYAAQELCTFAQVCLWVVGSSKMADVINERGDPGALHTAFAAELLAKTFEETQALVKSGNPEAVQARQGAKVANFGFLARMGAAKLVINKRSKREGSTTALDGTVYPGIRFCIALGGESRCGVEKVTEWNGRVYSPMCKRCVQVVEYDVRARWFENWEDANQYHDWCKDLVDRGGVFPCMVPCKTCGGKQCDDCEYRGWEVEVWRGGLQFSDGANNAFQFLGAAASKAAYRRLSKECYTDRKSVLYGTRPLFLLHDEIFSDMPIYRRHAASYRKVQIMVEEMQKYVPDIRAVKAEPALMTHWYKDAKEKFDPETKELIPWA